MDFGRDRASRNEKSFSLARVLQLFVMLLLPGIPLALWGLVTREMARREAVRAEQEKLDQSIKELEAKVRKGESGEAFRRLFGVKPEGGAKQQAAAAVPEEN